MSSPPRPSDSGLLHLPVPRQAASGLRASRAVARPASHRARSANFADPSERSITSCGHGSCNEHHAHPKERAGRTSHAREACGPLALYTGSAMAFPLTHT